MYFKSAKTVNSQTQYVISLFSYIYSKIMKIFVLTLGHSHTLYLYVYLWFSFSSCRRGWRGFTFAPFDVVQWPASQVSTHSPSLGPVCLPVSDLHTPCPLSLQVSVRSRNPQFPYARYFFLRSHFRKETGLLIFLNVLEWRWWTISLCEFMLTSPIVSLSRFLMTATLLTGLHVSTYVTYWSKLPLHTSS